MKISGHIHGPAGMTLQRFVRSWPVLPCHSQDKPHILSSSTGTDKKGLYLVHALQKFEMVTEDSFHLVHLQSLEASQDKKQNFIHVSKEHKFDC